MRQLRLILSFVLPLTGLLAGFAVMAPPAIGISGGTDSRAHSTEVDGRKARDEEAAARSAGVRTFGSRDAPNASISQTEEDGGVAAEAGVSAPTDREAASPPDGR